MDVGAALVSHSFQISVLNINKSSLHLTLPAKCPQKSSFQKSASPPPVAPKRYQTPAGEKEEVTFGLLNVFETLS